jgi:hypothetical protein
MKSLVTDVNALAFEAGRRWRPHVSDLVLNHKRRRMVEVYDLEVVPG